MSVDFGCQNYQSGLSGVADLVIPGDSSEIRCIGEGHDRHQSAAHWSSPLWFPAQQEENQAHSELV